MRPRRAGDPEELISNPVKAADLLGWQPKFSDLRTIVQTAWKWHTRDGAFPIEAPAAAFASNHA